MSDNKRKKRLRRGFTTGTAAAASVKAALIYLVTRNRPESVRVELLNKESWTIPVESVSFEGEAACATVVKDAGDDPDVTNGAGIGARVKLTPGSGRVFIRGGKGVGLVTRPGLEIPVGESAITPGPRKMIRNSVARVLADDLLKSDVHVEIFVPKGEVLAKKTLNHRLGIRGGISILGTTGVVNPMSHEAYIATIRSAMSVARACGSDHVVLTTGRRSERYAQKLFPGLSEENFIQIGDFFQMAMQCVKDIEFKDVTLAVFFGKALKMAQGIKHTHAAKAALTMDWLAGFVRKITGDDTLSGKIAKANTARHAFGMLWPGYGQVVKEVGCAMIRSASGFCDHASRVRAVIFDFDGNVAFDSGNARGEIQ